MITFKYGVMQLLAAVCVFIAGCHAETQRLNDNSTVPINSTVEYADDNQSKAENKIEDIVKQQRRAPRFESTNQSPWVRVYNKPPGAKADTYFNYETRGNTSAHTSGEIWDSFPENAIYDNLQTIDRGDVDSQPIRDILRVKPNKENPTSAPSASSVTAKPQTDTSKTAGQVTNPSTTTNDAVKKGYIAWSNGDGSSAAWNPNDTPGIEQKQADPAIEDIMPKDGSRWKVIGDGGQEGWQVVDDKGEVEWKIEYDQGEWRVTSTGETPEDVEWADPNYLWEPADGSLSEEDDYNWPVDDYAYASPWADAGQYVRGSGNYSWPTVGDGNQTGEHVKASGIQVQPINTEWRTGNPTGNTNIEKPERIQFGTRHRTNTNDNIRSNPAEDRTDKTENSDNLDHTDISPENKPQADEIRTEAKSWASNTVAVKDGPEWVQGYGSKTWEGDNTGWNVAYGGDTWLAANKDLSSGQWVPKAVAGKSQVQVLPQNPTVDPGTPGNLENPVRAWGTGYGSKTWKGNEWNSNVVWNTGFGGALPWTTDNVTWKFPDQNEYGYDEENKKPVTWSQPLPSSDPNSNETPGPIPKVDGVRIKWPSRPINAGGAVKKPPPNRRTEGESWGDDSSSGGVIWKGEKGNETPSNVPKGQELWKSGGWKIGTQEQDGKTTPVPPKTNAPPKSSNLLSVAWKTTGDPPIDAVPVVRAPWNQVQWPNENSNNGPTWTFGGCKMTIKCGVPESDDADDSPQQNISDESDSSMPPTDAPPVVPGKGWPKKQNIGKSWKPPPKSWFPPSWKKPTPPPTTMTWPPTTTPIMTTKAVPTPPPTMLWKSPPPPLISKSWKPPSNIKWKQPPPNIKWKQPAPPTTMMMTETTPPPPSMSWKAPQPPQIRWKKPGSKKSKSWRPPPTKSWKPPTSPSKTWQPSIATPVPDMWPTTKPDCKDKTETTQPPPAPTIEEEDMLEPPQIIIITKLPSNAKVAVPPKNPDTAKEDKKKASSPLPPGKWIFPPRKGTSKKSKNRKDKNIPIGGSIYKWPSRPSKNSKAPVKPKGWPKGVPFPGYGWPSNNMRRWTTKKPAYTAGWKPPKYLKPKTWKQLFNKVVNGR